jgi:hypothetical protein
MILPGEFLLRGELVDTKCWLGVMRPSTGKVHRACAVRCLAGGVPPGLLVRRDGEADRIVLLAGPEGRGPDFDPQWGGRVVEARGRLEMLGGLWVLRAGRIGLAR